MTIFLVFMAGLIMGTSIGCLVAALFFAAKGN